jgi:hypothetical protein
MHRPDRVKQSLPGTDHVMVDKSLPGSDQWGHLSMFMLDPAKWMGQERAHGKPSSLLAAHKGVTAPACCLTSKLDVKLATARLLLQNKMVYCCGGKVRITAWPLTDISQLAHDTDSVSVEHSAK